jgi:hypothetical protein
VCCSCLKKHEKDTIHNKFTEFELQRQSHLCLCEVHIVQQFHKLTINQISQLLKWITHQNKILHQIVKWNENWDNSQTNNSKCPNIWFLAVISVCNWFRSHPTNWTNSTLCLNTITQFSSNIVIVIQSHFTSFKWKNTHFSFIWFLKNSCQSKILNTTINSKKWICVNCQFQSVSHFQQKWKMTQKNWNESMNQWKTNTKKKKYRNFGLSTFSE